MHANLWVASKEACYQRQEGGHLLATAPGRPKHAQPKPTAIAAKSHSHCTSY